jgi:hypothetical protein
VANSERFAAGASLGTTDLRPVELPAPATEIVGRDAEIATIGELLDCASTL